MILTPMRDAQVRNRSTTGAGQREAWFRGAFMARSISCSLVYLVLYDIAVGSTVVEKLECAVGAGASFHRRKKRAACYFRIARTSLFYLDLE